MKAKFLFIVFSVFILSGCDYAYVDTVESEKRIKIAIESAYFEGQKDAINGDIRIGLNNDSCWVWTKSPWNNGDLVTFRPDTICLGDKNK